MASYTSLSSPRHTSFENEKLPGQNAPVAEIRAFLSEILVSHGADTDEARRLALRWAVGTGSDLRNSPSQVFCATFGDLAGFVLYSRIRVLVGGERGGRFFSPKTRRKSEATPVEEDHKLISPFARRYSCGHHRNRPSICGLLSSREQV